MQKLAKFLGVLIGVVALNVANAKPFGEPPPKNYFVPKFWSLCVGPVKLGMQGSANVYSLTDRKSKVIGTLTRGQRVTVLAQVDVVIEPGLATVVGPFEINILKLAPGTDVYILDDEPELDYLNAWYGGKEVEGGLPILDSRAFLVKKMPVVEQWVKVKVPYTLYRTGWALNGEAFYDQRAMNDCERAYTQ